MPSTFSTDARLAAVAAGQQGAFTRAQATTAGFAAAQITRRVQAGAWTRVLPAVYCHATAPRSQALELWATVIWARPPCAVSHATAAALWGIAPWEGGGVEIVVARPRAPRTAGVAVHRVGRLDATDVAYMRGLPVTTPVRTVIDLAAGLGEHDLRPVVDRARTRGLVTVRAVSARLDEIGAAGRPGAGRLRAVLEAIGSGVVEPSARMAG
jgi:predicted transcriptional regulator of viral defense system